jgi:hypothetical protein
LFCQVTDFVGAAGTGTKFLPGIQAYQYIGGMPQVQEEPSLRQLI